MHRIKHLIIRYPYRTGGLSLCLALLVWLYWPLSLFDAPYSTVLLDRNDKLIGASIAKDEQWRFPPDLKIPDKFSQALLTFEDKRFFSHPGVDPLALARATWTNIKERRVISGASTLTMQTIRLSRKGQSRTVFEKLIEMAYALRLERTTGKQDILRLYAAHAPFGGNVVGLEAASWRYFGREPDKLSWAESAMLAVLPNAPSLIHPGKNRERLLQKRNNLLKMMWRQGVMDSLSYVLASQESLPPSPLPIPMIAPHLTARAGRIGLQDDAAKKGRYRTTLVNEIQIRTIDILKRHHRTLSGNGIHNAAAIILEVETGRVVAYVGNVPGTRRAEFVDIIRAPRSTGSLLKPFLYAGMVESGEILPTALVPDIPLRIKGFAPQNYSKSFEGAVPAAMALSRSLNVPAVRMLHSYGVDRFYTFLQKLGMSSLHRSADAYGLSLILGGSEGSLWELTGMYAGMARRLNLYLSGDENTTESFTRPVWLTSDLHDESSKNNTSIEHPISAGATWLTLEAMLEVVRPGTETAWRSFMSSRKVAWKTGTSHGFRDAWAIGVTPRYAVGVWVGNADGEGRPGLVGVQVAAPIMFELFGLLQKGRWFTYPEADMFEIEVCARSGFQAGPYCDSKRPLSVTEQGVRAERCMHCRRVHLDKNLVYQVDSSCARVADIKSENRFVLPPAIEWYYMKRHSDYESLPPHNPACTHALELTGAPAISFIYPTTEGSLYIPLELDGSRGRAVFQAAHTRHDATVYWHLDESYIGATRDLHQMPLAPPPGRHTLTLVDDHGESITRNFTILAKQ